MHRWTTTGTHLGPFLGIPPTKKKLSIDGMTVSRFGPDGKITEIYNFHDRMAWMEQFGLKGWFWAIVKRSWKY
jgi:predicted ester cyclase